MLGPWIWGPTHSCHCTLWPRPATCQKGHGRTSPPLSSILELTSSSRKPPLTTQPTLCPLLWTQRIDGLPVSPTRHINSGSEMTLAPQGPSPASPHRSSPQMLWAWRLPSLCCPVPGGLERAHCQLGKDSQGCGTELQHQTLLSLTWAPTPRRLTHPGPLSHCPSHLCSLPRPCPSARALWPVSSRGWGRVSLKGLDRALLTLVFGGPKFSSTLVFLF